MATQSPWRCHFSCSPTPCLHSSPGFLLYYTKRRPTVPWASSFKSKSSSPSSSSSSYSCAANTFSSNVEKRLRRKSVGSITVGNDSDDNEVTDSSLNGNDSLINGKFSTFKSLFGKRALWRRILFASRKVRSIILLNVITIIYASNIPVVKEVEAITDPKAFTVVRFCVAAIPFIPFVVQAKVDARTRNAGIELGFWVSLGYILQALGLLTSDAGRASFLSMFTVIVVPLIDGLLGSAVPTRTWFGALMSIVGVAMLESSGSPPCIGDLLNFLSAVSFGIHMLRTEHISRSTKSENFLPLLGYEVCVVALLSTAWYFMEGWFGGHIQESDPFSWTFATVLNSISSFPWVPALYTGIFSTGLCLWVEMTAMCDISATETAIIYGLEPVWGAGFAWVLLGERWGLSGWIGAALVLGGSLTVQIMGARKKLRNNPTIETEGSHPRRADCARNRDLKLQQSLTRSRTPATRLFQVDTPLTSQGRSAQEPLHHSEPQPKTNRLPKSSTITVSTAAFQPSERPKFIQQRHCLATTNTTSWTTKTPTSPDPTPEYRGEKGQNRGTTPATTTKS
ncbi:Unknown protein [Striga hermonthica]|uniref:EamA domain-containing protein n=1 Tax=Striga hermonthica TaxID=68872 RepID=A0A9N7RIK0_STRHE|nr:Unknown protein [Striga hermonthica]